MTAPPTPGVDLGTALALADRRWCQLQCDEPLDPARRNQLVAAMNELLGNPTSTAADLDNVRAEVDQLREQLAAEHRDTLRAIGMLEAARRERDEFADDLIEVRRENGRLRAECNGLADLLTEAAKNRDAARAERDQLAALLEEGLTRITDMQRQVEEVVATAEQITAAAAEALAPAPHRHAWEWQPGLKALPLPCACGRPWPRNQPPTIH